MNNIVTETYEMNLSLEILYDVIESLYDKNHFNYPTDINNMIKDLLKEIEKYSYHIKL